MKYRVLWVGLACVFMSGIATAQADLASWGLKGRVKFVEQYTTNYCCSPNERKKLPRRLSAVASFDRKGNFLERIGFHNDNGGASYERWVFRYDPAGRKVGADVFKSEKTEPETYFTISGRETGRARFVPVRAERLKERILYGYDTSGRLNEIVTRDPNENLVLRRLFQHDADGNVIRVTVLKADGVVEHESITAIFEGGRRKETTSIRPGGASDVHVSKVDWDKKGRVLSGETFALRTDAEKRSRYARLTRALYTYTDGRERRMDWWFYKPDGMPESKIIVLRNERGDEVDREELTAGPLPVGSQNEDIEPVWTLRRRTVTNREYDKRGNETKIERLDQCGPNLPLELDNVGEHVIIYH